MRISLTDNNIVANTYSRNDVAALFPIADKSISQLCRENEHLLVFPFSIEDTDDRIGEASVLNIKNTDDPEKVTINTANIMGFIGVENLQIKIKSRFDEGRDDFLLHYMLQKVLSFNLFDLSHNNEHEDVFDFVMFMFPYFLKRAMRQGVFREYQHFKHNDSDIKGPVDVCRHINRNVPFVGKIAYSTREYSSNNRMTQLIRHTIEFMKTKKYGMAVLNIDRETAENVRSIIEHTANYNKCERNSVISKNLRFKRHPYYTEYHALQSLCLQILRMEEVKYGEHDDEICGILFDGAWLWEEYVNTILRDYGFKHPANKLRKGRIYLFEDNSGVRYPGFYKEGVVLDAKYKRLGSYDNVARIDRDDIHQVISYMGALKATKGGFVSPLEKKQTIIPTKKLKDSTSTLSIFGVEICRTAHSYADFCVQMKIKEQEFIESLHL